MGIPYVVVCESSDVSTLLEEAQKAGHSAKVIGEIRDNL
jgi:phosphoribosylaminoimidazole (AIR) synthetase